MIVALTGSQRNLLDYTCKVLIPEIGIDVSDNLLDLVRMVHEITYLLGNPLKNLSIPVTDSCLVFLNLGIIDEITQVASKFHIIFFRLKVCLEIEGVLR
jgi:hypothetical protein